MALRNARVHQRSLSPGVVVRRFGGSRHPATDIYCAHEGDVLEIVDLLTDVVLSAVKILDELQEKNPNIKIPLLKGLENRGPDDGDGL